jgi:hypothetical protein
VVATALFGGIFRSGESSLDFKKNEREAIKLEIVKIADVRTQFGGRGKDVEPGNTLTVGEL